MVGAITLLHPRVRMVVEDMRWSLTPIQEAGIPDLIEGSDRLLIAPTGSGKTEAAILPLISRALTEGWTGLSILYITPLRALNRDIDRRLTRTLAPLGLEVGVRHGDTSKKERRRQSMSPPELLVTTPETAQIMLQGSRLRGHLAGVRAIVLDEVHDLASSERGSQLLVGLERIKDLGSERMQLVGLSATVGNPNEVAKWFSKHAEPIIGPAARYTERRGAQGAGEPRGRVAVRRVVSLSELGGRIQETGSNTAGGLAGAGVCQLSQYRGDRRTAPLFNGARVDLGGSPR